MHTIPASCIAATVKPGRISRRRNLNSWKRERERRRRKRARERRTAGTEGKGTERERERMRNKEEREREGGNAARELRSDGYTRG